MFAARVRRRPVRRLPVRGAVLAAALALAGGSAGAAGAAQAAAAGTASSAIQHPVTGPAGTGGPAGPGYRRACAVTRQPGIMSCMALVRAGASRAEASFGGTAPSGYGYGPDSLTSAYNLPASTAVTKIAVIDAFDDPDAESDLATYRSAWGLPGCDPGTGSGCLTVTNERGQPSPLPAGAASTGWATEVSVDVDMVSAVCPACHVYLVEADNGHTTALGAAVDTAVNVLGAQFVSNSYGGSQGKNDPAFDTRYYRHPGAAIVASAGDDGYGASYPAASPYVTSVGGTTLNPAPQISRGWTETVWGGGVDPGLGTGSGCALSYEPRPSWQSGHGCRHRIDNDVAAVANPETGVAVYDSYDHSGWFEAGGTSVSTPLITAVFALADDVQPGTYPSSYPYAGTAALYDVTSGNNGSCGNRIYLCTAGAGYDGPTGLGTPNGTAAFAYPTQRPAAHPLHHSTRPASHANSHSIRQ